MQKWNRQLNLSGSDDDLFIIRQHFIDSLSCTLSSVLRPQSRLLDIGTGAGFPAIPLKIYYPDLSVTAVDAVSKKMMFLRHLCRVLRLQNVICLATRIEQVSNSSELLPEHVDVIVSRAVGSVADLLKLGLPFLKPNGHFLFQRGKKGKTELVENQQLFEKHHIQIVDNIEVRLSFLSYPRYLLVLRKK